MSDFHSPKHCMVTDLDKGTDRFFYHSLASYKDTEGYRAPVIFAHYKPIMLASCGLGLQTEIQKVTNAHGFDYLHVTGTSIINKHTFFFT